MEFIRTDSGIVNTDLFYPNILVFVEGHTDFPFYEEVLGNYNYHLKAQGGKTECKKLVEVLLEKDLPFVVVLDGDYGILETKRSKHRRVVLLHRYSFENYLIEKEPIEQFCRDYKASENRLKQLENEYNAILDLTRQKFEELIILDVAHQRAETGKDVLPDKSGRFFKKSKKVEFSDSQIEQHTKAAKNVNQDEINEATALVKKYQEERRFVDMIPGHFAFGIIGRFVSNIVGGSIKYDDLRIYLSRVVWKLVKRSDHNSLKNRLRQAVRDAAHMRKISIFKT